MQLEIFKIKNTVNLSTTVQNITEKVPNNVNTNPNRNPNPALQRQHNSYTALGQLTSNS